MFLHVHMCTSIALNIFASASIADVACKITTLAWSTVKMRILNQAEIDATDVFIVLIPPVCLTGLELRSNIIRRIYGSKAVCSAGSL